MRKGVAVPYVIAILLGIVVIAIIGFTFFTSTTSISVQDCRNKLSTYCSLWSATGYTGKPSGEWDDFAKGCSQLGVADPSEPDCRARIGTLLGVGATCENNAECQSKVCEPNCVPTCPTGFASRATPTCTNARCSVTCLKAGEADQTATCSTPKKCK